MQAKKSALKITGSAFDNIYHSALKTLARELAIEFEVSESTVMRWAKGTAKPHPKLRDQVIASIRNRRDNPPRKQRKNEA